MSALAQLYPRALAVPEDKVVVVAAGAAVGVAEPVVVVVAAGERSSRPS
jgi:hypothetical protein